MLIHCFIHLSISDDDLCLSIILSIVFQFYLQQRCLLVFSYYVMYDIVNLLYILSNYRKNCQTLSLSLSCLYFGAFIF